MTGRRSKFSNLQYVQGIFNELENCDEQIVPNCLRALYDFVYYPLVPDKNSLAIGKCCKAVDD